MTQSTKPLIVRRIIETPRSRVFEAFSEAELLEQWFTPSADISVRASLLLEAGRPGEARAAFARALTVTQNARELTFIEAKIKNLH